MSQVPRSEQGDTLVEVLVSVVILAIVVAGLMAGMTTTITSANISRDQANAETLLTSVGEAVRDPTQYHYDCSGASYTFANVVSTLGLTGWTATVKNIVLWNTTTQTFDPTSTCTSPAQNVMQDITIQVQSADGQLKWTREVVKGQPS